MEGYRLHLGILCQSLHFNWVPGEGGRSICGMAHRTEALKTKWANARAQALFQSQKPKMYYGAIRNVDIYRIFIDMIE